MRWEVAIDLDAERYVRERKLRTEHDRATTVINSAASGHDATTVINSAASGHDATADVLRAR